LEKITVNTATRNYPVFIGAKIFELLPELVSKHKLPLRTFVIIDKNIDRIFGKLIRSVTHSFSSKKYILTLPSSERIKSFGTVQKIITQISNEKFSRDTLIIAIGGGTVGDVTGFVASTYMRGVPLVHIPTTLLSAVDSSIGGKNAINFGGIKNLIGTFYQPSIVIIDPSLVTSLPKKELISGLGEMIKYSYLTEGNFYSELLSNLNAFLSVDVGYLNKAIIECVKIKSAVVSQDEQDLSGVRKILNFGHTFAHAFESYFSYRFSHGKAVLAGIVCALFLSFKKGLINEGQLEYMLKIPLSLKSSIRLKDFDSREILRLMNFDKKRREGEIRFVLIENFGEILVDVVSNLNDIKWALANTKKVLV